MRSTHHPLTALAALILLATPSAALQSQSKPSSASHATVAMTSPHKWTREQVMEAQRGLAAAKMYRGKIDGVLGRETETAIREYQRVHQLTVNGQLSDDLLAHLKAGTVAPAEPARVPSPMSPTSTAAKPVYQPEPMTQPTRGATSAAPAAPPLTSNASAATRSWRREEVMAAQQGLTRAKLYHGVATGTLDQPTINAIREFQRANGLAVTGELSDALLARLKGVK